MIQSVSEFIRLKPTWPKKVVELGPTIFISLFDSTRPKLSLFIQNTNNNSNQLKIMFTVNNPVVLLELDSFSQEEVYGLTGDVSQELVD